MSCMYVILTEKPSDMQELDFPHPRFFFETIVDEFYSYYIICNNNKI